jgi:hypothetical protein
MNKETLSHIIPVIHETVPKQPAVKAQTGLPGPLTKFMHWLKGDKENKSFAPDPAAEIIARIENAEIAGFVKDLHYKTPKSLQAMRNTCQECFVLPDDSLYWDYTIFDIKKAKKRFAAQLEHSHLQVIVELQKVNNELAYHLNEYLEEISEPEELAATQ